METQEMHYFSYINFISHYIPRVHSPPSFAHNGKLHSWKQRAGLVPQNAFPHLQTCGSKNGDRPFLCFIGKGFLICAPLTLNTIRRHHHNNRYHAHLSLTLDFYQNVSTFRLQGGGITDTYVYLTCCHDLSSQLRDYVLCEVCAERAEVYETDERRQ